MYRTLYFSAGSKLADPVTKPKRKPKIFCPQGPVKPVNYENTPFAKHAWLILPKVPNECQYTLRTAGNTIVSILNNLKEKRHKLVQRKGYTDHVFITPYTLTLKLIDRCIRLAVKNELLRKRFGKLARHIIRSKIQNGNDEDLFTGEVPKRPITLIDLKARRKYVFEASTIVRDIGSRILLNVYGEFPLPKPPRNPYTNLDMTLGQFTSIYHQLRAAIATNWMLEGLYSAQYDIKRFTHEMYGKLRHTLIRIMFTDTSDANGRRMLIDFIDDFHDKYDFGCDLDTYDWAVHNAPNAKRIVDWRTACYDYHIRQLTSASKDDEKGMALLLTRIQRLCWSEPLELKRLKSQSEAEVSVVL